ncbi:hypothetical protein KZ483_18455 [Paenibacillus sp. sptzw28]|uniref:hypothetical protein n=1 Tax=Paenibacillus sp. sptzw28 TaxID=715179 RepID=UPI001C6F3B3B|nr:hypothetical protein [Paenibacillus sp. sptzw28]QYR19848.1 hypothetical protein KZ483_18455 [Paenibacillus sp. sptzw28]
MESMMIHNLNLLHHSLISLVANWKRGSGYAGYMQFLESTEQLESIADLCSGRVDGKYTAEISGLLNILQHMEQCIRNNDIIGLTDAMEFQLHPFILRWTKDVSTSAGN